MTHWGWHLPRTRSRSRCCRDADVRISHPHLLWGRAAARLKTERSRWQRGPGVPPPSNPPPPPPSDLTTAGQGWRPTPPSPTPCLSFPISCDAPMHAVGERFPPQPPPCLSLPIAVTPQHTHRGSGGGRGERLPRASVSPLIALPQHTQWSYGGTVPPPAPPRASVYL